MLNPCDTRALVQLRLRFSSLKIKASHHLVYESTSDKVDVAPILQQLIHNSPVDPLASTSCHQHVVAGSVPVLISYAAPT